MIFTLTNEMRVPVATHIERLKWDDELLAEIPFPKAVMRVTRGIGSGLTRRKDDPPGQFWAIGDRGPNVKPAIAIERFGLENQNHLTGIDGAKIMPSLAHGPCLAQLRVVGDRVILMRVFPLLDQNGQPLSGLPVSTVANNENEPVYSCDGTPLGTNPSGVDSEGIVALDDGGFWISDEYGPSLLRIDAGGQVIVRWVPEGSEADFAGGAFPVLGVIPSLASARRLNRGFEAIALSPDQLWLYVVFQSPLAHPDRAAHAASRNVRVWKIDANTGAFAAEYVYRLEKPEAFKRDGASGRVQRSDVKVSEGMMLGDTALILLERVSASTKLYRVDLTSEYEVPAEYRYLSTRPTIEQMDGKAFAVAAIRSLDKILVFDSDAAPEICADLEGMILLSPRALLLVNDNDFGVEGVETQFWRVTFDSDLIQESATVK